MAGRAGVVTLLFTDLVASTELLARLGDDAAEEVRRTHFQLLREVVRQTGGEEVKSLGDGLMVVFPSALDGLRCAVSMQGAIQRHNEAGPGPDLGLRVGVHAGEPVRDGEDYHGEAVVIASRLCNQAEGGQILTTELVAGLAGNRGGFRFRPAGRLRLKGLPQTVPAMTLEWRQPEAASPERGKKAAPAVMSQNPPREPPAPRGPRLVGRDRELAVLDSELERVAAGEFRCVLLVGEAGIGKTRLAGEVAARRRAAVTSLSARAFTLGETTAFGLWVEALERHLRSLDPAEVERICAGRLDDLAGLLGSVRAVRGHRRDGVDADAPRSRVMEALTVALSNLAREQPLVIILDDIHLADSSSLELLQYVAHGCSETPILVVATARPAELGDRPETAELLSRLEQDGLLVRLPVGTVDAAALAGLAESITGERARPALVEWIEARSGGNPLYAIGLLRALVEEKASLAAPALRRLPESLIERVSGRLHLLDASAQAVLELLAVLGRRVDARALVGLSNLDSDELTDILDRLVAARAVVEEEYGLQLTYEITHPLVAEAIYQGIGAGRRRRLHRQAGRALLSAGRLGEAAPHFVRSAEPGDDEAIGVLREAVHRAEQSESYREALTILGSLVDLIPSGDPRWADLVDALAWDADWVIYHRADTHAAAAIPALRAMDRALGGLGDSARQAPVKLRLATFLTWGTGDADEAQVLCEEAQRLFEAAGDQHGALLARHELAWIASHRGDMATAERIAAQVVEEAALGDRSVYDRALRTFAMVAIWRSRFEEGDAAIAEVLARARQGSDPYRTFLPLIYTGLSLTMQGRISEASEWLEKARAVGATVDDHEKVAAIEMFGWWYAGDYRAVLERTGQTGAVLAGSFSLQRALGISGLAMAALEMGELDDARRWAGYARSRSVYGERHYGWYSEPARHAEALLAWREGRPHDAVATLTASVARLLAMGAEGLAIPALVDLAELRAALGQADPTAHDAFDALAGRTGLDVHRGLTELAAAWGAAGDPPLAASHARRAVTFIGPNWPIYLARAQAFLGRVTPDRKEAVDALRSAVAIFDDCGALLRRAEALDVLATLGSAGKRAAGAARGPGSLTAQERSVAVLAASGLPAREIGERLFIGKRTVEGHLARAYAKLGVTSKVELARRAAELDLLPDA